jgi:hypothetical protein
VQLRKDRRDENLQKKRMVTAVVAEGGELESTRGGQAVQQKVRGPAPPTRPHPPPVELGGPCLLTRLPRSNLQLVPPA